jgi:hypothetical protein
MHTYLFVLSPPFSGSTVVWKLLSTSPMVSAHPIEGQFLDGVKQIMYERRWDPGVKFPWLDIKARWEQEWDMTKPLLLEKSPPNIVRAAEIENAFDPSYFVALIRNPYAFCESARRRKNTIRGAAERWVECATYQVRNIKGLKNLIYFRYEDFADGPEQIKTQILDFMPALQTIDITRSFEARSILGRGAKRIRNFNRENIDRLSIQEFAQINEVLRQNEHLMNFFGYEYLKPTVAQSLRHFKVRVRCKTAKYVGRVKKSRFLLIYNRTRHN